MTYLKKKVDMHSLVSDAPRRKACARMKMNRMKTYRISFDRQADRWVCILISSFVYFKSICLPILILDLIFFFRKGIEKKSPGMNSDLTTVGVALYRQ